MAKRLLLIDDDIDDSEMFKEALSSVDPACICERYTHGRIALTQLQSNQVVMPDMIFLDINLPSMSGWEILTQLKKLDELKNIPVIMYSTSSAQRDRDIAMDLGALCFFTKPGNFKVLIRMLDIVVENMNKGAIDEICASVYKALN